MSINLSALFIEAKRSLAIAEGICGKANELVCEARNSVERITGVNARTEFIYKALIDQLNSLITVRTSLQVTRRSSLTQLKEILAEIDKAYEDLEDVLNILNDTPLLPSLINLESNTLDLNSNNSNNTDNKSTNDNNKSIHKNLHDFVDTNGIEKLQRLLDDSINAIQSFVTDFESKILNFDNDFISLLKQSNNVLPPEKRLSFPDDLKAQIQETSSNETSDIPKSSIDTAMSKLKLMDEQVEHLALLLESLTRHYDLCLKIVSSEKSEVSGSKPLPSNNSASHYISEEQRQEALQVLDNDSKEINNVINELNNNYNLLEDSNSQISKIENDILAIYTATTKCFESFDFFSRNSVAGYVSQSQEFQDTFNKEMNNLNVLSRELQALKNYYEYFRNSYDALLIEIKRREKAQEKASKFAQNAAAELENLFEQESAAQNEFSAKYGNYLPIDLWSGLAIPPAKFTITSSNLQSFPEVDPNSLELVLARQEIKKPIQHK